MKWLIRLAASLAAFGALVGREGPGAAMETAEEAIELGRVFWALWSSPGGGSVARAARQEVVFHEDPTDRVDVLYRFIADRMADATVPSDAFSALQSLREMAKANKGVDGP